MAREPDVASNLDWLTKESPSKESLLCGSFGDCTWLSGWQTILADISSKHAKLLVSTEQLYTITNVVDSGVILAQWSIDQVSVESDYFCAYI